MVRSLTLSMLSIVSEWMLIWHPLPNKTLNTVVCIVLLLLYVILLGIAYDKEQKMIDRIQALEDEIEDYAGHVHQLMRKQSGKIIEYCTGEED